MAVTKFVHPQKISPWAIGVEKYLLLFRKHELVDLLCTAGRSVSVSKHRPAKKSDKYS